MGARLWVRDRRAVGRWGLEGVRADAFVSAWKWLEELLNLNKVGTVEQVYPMYWTLAEAGECHANVSAYAQVHGEEWKRVFGYAIDVSGNGRFQMHDHSVVRNKSSRELRYLTSDKNAMHGFGLFVADAMFDYCSFEEVMNADERMQELLTKRFSEPRCIANVCMMPFGCDTAAEANTLRVMQGASKSRDGLTRSRPARW